jgi:DNA-binding NtrC family response regulator
VRFAVSARPLSARWMCGLSATNRPLATAVASGSFPRRSPVSPRRRPHHAAPLRERLGGLAALAVTFCGRWRSGRAVGRRSRRALPRWRVRLAGNIRELQNGSRRCRGGAARRLIGPAAPPHVARGGSGPAPRSPTPAGNSRRATCEPRWHARAMRRRWRRAISDRRQGLAAMGRLGIADPPGNTSSRRYDAGRSSRARWRAFSIHA